MRVTLEFPQGTFEADVAEPFLATVNWHIVQRGLGIADAFKFLKDIAYFEENREMLSRDYAGRSVAIVDGRIFASRNEHEAVRIVEAERPGRLYYLVDIPAAGRLPELFDAAAPPQRYRYEEIDGRPSARRVG